MQKKKYTRFGYVLHYSLCLISVGAFLTAFLACGACESETISLGKYALTEVIAVPVMWACVRIHERVFEGGFKDE